MKLEPETYDVFGPRLNSVVSVNAVHEMHCNACSASAGSRYAGSRSDGKLGVEQAINTVIEVDARQRRKPLTSARPINQNKIRGGVP